MKLPTIVTAQYELELPSNGKKIQYRPYLAKEEKILLMAKESKKQEDVIGAIIQIIDNCTVGIGNVKELPICDFEYVFLKLRAKSSGETAQVGRKCSNKECGHVIKINVDLDTIEPTLFTETHHSDIVLATNPTIGVRMKYPTVNFLVQQETAKAAVATIDVIKECLVHVYDDAAVYPVGEADADEVDVFLGSLNFDMLNQIKKDFFDTTPKLIKEVQATCTKCDTDNSFTLKGITDFF